MAEMQQSKEYEQLGCGLVGAFFQFGSSKTKKSSSVPPAIPAETNNKTNSLNSKRNRGRSSGEMMMRFLGNSNKPPPEKQQNNFVIYKNKKQPEKRTTNSNLVLNSEYYTQKLRKVPTFTSSELSLTIHRKSNAGAGNSSASNLGNLKQNGNKKSISQDVKGSSKTLHKGISNYSTMGNILKNPNNYNKNRLDPEEIKSIGNEKFRLGKLEEALSLYNQAIALDPDKACFYSNKSAALMGLGRLVEAVFQCLEAIRIEPSYQNAHFRLARLYFR